MIGEADTKIALAGRWRFRLDPDRRGADERWFHTDLPDEIALPGSTDDGGYGRENSVRELTYLTRVKTFEGQAWYQTDIDIPEKWAGKKNLLFLERCMWETDLWIDDEYVGWNDSLLTPHLYDISDHASPGAHRLTLLVDSSPRGTPKKFRNHAYGEHTQIVWNGVIGRIELMCLGMVHLVDIQVFPNVTERSIRVVSKIGNDRGIRRVVAGGSCPGQVDRARKGDGLAGPFRGSAKAIFRSVPSQLVCRERLAFVGIPLRAGDGRFIPRHRGHEWNSRVKGQLKDGARVVLFVRPLMNAEPTRFATVFWSPFWVPEQPMSCGLLIDCNHPSLSQFPTDTHTNWHWWELLSIVREVTPNERELYHGSGVLSPARAAVLNDFPPELHPIV